MIHSLRMFEKIRIGTIVVIVLGSNVLLMMFEQLE